MPSKQTNEEHAKEELDAFFENHAAALTPERIAIELERIPNRYDLEDNDVLIDHLRKRLRETTEETHPELHRHASSYLRLKWMEDHGSVDEIFNLNNNPD